MSASVTTSSRRRPVRATRSSSEREARDGAAAGGPVVRADVAEPARRVDRLEHRRIVAAALRTASTRSSQPHLGQPERGVGWRPGALDGSASWRAIALPDLLAQAAHVAQAEPDRAVGFDRAVPVGHLHVDRMKADAAALRVLHERRRVVEPHRLVVEERRVERRRIVHLQIRARVGEQREARRVRLGKAVERERRDRRDDLLRRRRR